MCVDTSLLYDHAFFQKHSTWQRDYIRIADALSGTLEFDTVLDLGCGNAYIIERLLYLGKKVHGIEGSACAFDVMSPRIKKLVQLRDLTVPLFIARFDMVICTEVAEHLLPDYADILVDTICANSLRYVYFTAATPGQGGQFHFNEQPHEYWKQKFSARGYIYSKDITRRLRGELKSCVQKTRWLVRNSLIFLAPSLNLPEKCY